MTLYKILGEDGFPCYGGFGKWTLPNSKRPGKWMPVIKNIELCNRGYHLVKPDGLLEWLGPTLYEAEGRGESKADTTKIVYAQARVIRRIEAWNDRNARLFAADCAARALQRWRERYRAKTSPVDVDPRSTAAVVAARQFARGEIESAAKNAAESAAWNAAKSAAKSAAWSAAESAEHKWQLDRLWMYLRGEEPTPVPLPEITK